MQGRKISSVPGGARVEERLTGPEIRSQMGRCLHVGVQMPPMIDWDYNANFQIATDR